jgi:hypothetical protein
MSIERALGIGISAVTLGILILDFFNHPIWEKIDKTGSKEHVAV